MEEVKELKTLYNEYNHLKLIKLIVGKGHLDNYYEEWINYKMRDFTRFWFAMDLNNRLKYVNLNKMYIKYNKLL